MNCSVKMLSSTKEAVPLIHFWEDVNVLHLNRGSCASDLCVVQRPHLPVSPILPRCLQCSNHSRGGRFNQPQLRIFIIRVFIHKSLNSLQLSIASPGRSRPILYAFDEDLRNNWAPQKGVWEDRRITLLKILDKSIWLHRNYNLKSSFQLPTATAIEDT